MAGTRIIGGELKSLPWQPRAVADGVVWRHTGNPIIGWNPTPRTARVFNSAILPYGDGFVGVFRADHRNGKPALHVGWSTDGLAWDIEDREIQWRDEEGELYQPDYAYDPRLIALDDVHYVLWCTDFGGAALGLGRTVDFRGFTRLENVSIPFNRNGVLFPRKVNGKYLLLTRPSDSGHTPVRGHLPE